MDKKYILANNIILTKEWIPIGNTENHFIGKLDGNNCKISGLNINNVSGAQALFGVIGTTGEIHNMELEGSIYGSNNLGMICGQNYGKIENVAVNGEMSCDGGIIGGVAARNWPGGQIIACSANVVIKKWGSTGYDYDKGGIVGVNNGLIENSYSKGSIEGDKNIGGIVGSCVGGVVRSTYSVASVTASNRDTCGGIAGVVMNEGMIENSYWCSELSGATTGVEGTKLTLEQMKQQSSYEGWDFENVWIMKEKPELRCFQD